ncbi:hypothetical protein [Streptomyces huasconensis]|uniref:hypothetical protein n=1 Tax=Streptomyces huasconensis TaxID=1854574 RepID=UPI0036F4BF37
MDRGKLLALYDWDQGVCFRHPSRGDMATTVVKTIRPRINGEYRVRACPDCIIAMEAKREEAARKAGARYEPGRAGETWPS